MSQETTEVFGLELAELMLAVDAGEPPGRCTQLCKEGQGEAASGQCNIPATNPRTAQHSDLALKICHIQVSPEIFAGFFFDQELGHSPKALRCTNPVGNLTDTGLLAIFPAFPISGFAVSVPKVRTFLWGLHTGTFRGKTKSSGLK